MFVTNLGRRMFYNIREGGEVGQGRLARFQAAKLVHQRREIILTRLLRVKRKG